MKCKSWPLSNPKRRRIQVSAWKSCPEVSCTKVEKDQQPQLQKRSPIQQHSRCSRESDPLPGPSGISQRAVAATSTKRKSATEVEQDSPRKRSRLNKGTQDSNLVRKETKALEEQVSSASATVTSSSTEESSSEFESEEVVMYTGRVHSQDLEELNSKYRQFTLLKSGGFGHVYGGVRNEDNFFVAIKRVPKYKVYWCNEKVNGIRTSIPLEVQLLIQVGAGPDSNKSSITPQLLDWYDLKDEVVLVMERPEPCSDLYDYIKTHSPGGLSPTQAQVIFRQLLDAAIEMEARGVFHRDIKPRNILIDIGTGVPRARFIDFGSGTTFTPGEVFREPLGTPLHACPEWFRQEPYAAGPATVWQLGLVLYIMLFDKMPLIREETLGSMRAVPLPCTIPFNCRDVMEWSLNKRPKRRPTLKDLKNLPWIKPDP